MKAREAKKRKESQALTSHIMVNMVEIQIFVQKEKVHEQSWHRFLSESCRVAVFRLTLAESLLQKAKCKYEEVKRISSTKTVLRRWRS